MGPKFRRQHPFGPYVVDFYCRDARLVVKVDGGQHFEPDNAVRDAERSRYLEAAGLQVLRFTNAEVLTQTEAVLEAIWVAAKAFEPFHE